MSILGAAVHRPAYIREERPEIFEFVFGNDIQPVVAEANRFKRGKSLASTLAVDAAFLQRRPVTFLFQRQGGIAMRHDFPVRVDNEYFHAFGQFERGQKRPQTFDANRRGEHIRQAAVAKIDHRHRNFEQRLAQFAGNIEMD